MSLLRVEKPEEVDKSIWVKVQNLYLNRSLIAHTLAYILLATMGVKDEDVLNEIFKEGCGRETCIDEDEYCCNMEFVSKIVSLNRTAEFISLAVGFALLLLMFWKKGFSRLLLAFWVFQEMNYIEPILNTKGAFYNNSLKFPLLIDLVFY